MNTKIFIWLALIAISYAASIPEGPEGLAADVALDPHLEEGSHLRVARSPLYYVASPLLPRSLWAYSPTYYY